MEESEEDGNVDPDSLTQGKKGMTPRKTASRSIKPKNSTRKTTKAINTSQSTPRRRQPRKARHPRTPRTLRKAQSSPQGSTVDPMSHQSNAPEAVRRSKSPTTPMGPPKSPPSSLKKSKRKVKIPEKEDRRMSPPLEDDYPMYPPMDSCQATPSVHTLTDISYHHTQPITESSLNSSLSTSNQEQAPTPTSEC